MRRRKNVFVRGTWDVVRSLIAPVLFSVFIMAMIVFGLRQTSYASSEEGLRILEDGIRRAVITAYAIEGRFPASLSHIEENYGIFIDRTRYIVHYMPFGENVMPSITVLERDPERVMPNIFRD